MPKSKRDNLKRTLAQAYININYSGSYLHTLEETFKEAHPELAEVLTYSMEGLVNIQELLTSFARSSWLVDDVPWETWAGANRPRHDDPEAITVLVFIQSRIAQLKQERETFGDNATLEVNAPLALMQLSIESKIAELELLATTLSDDPDTEDDQ